MAIDVEQTNVAGQSGGLMSRIGAWSMQPFSSNMDLVNWVLFVGLLMVAAWFWSQLVNKITEIS